MKRHHLLAILATIAYVSLFVVLIIGMITADIEAHFLGILPALAITILLHLATHHLDDIIVERGYSERGAKFGWLTIASLVATGIAVASIIPLVMLGMANDAARLSAFSEAAHGLTEVVEFLTLANIFFQLNVIKGEEELRSRR